MKLILNGKVYKVSKSSPQIKMTKDNIVIGNKVVKVVQGMKIYINSTSDSIVIDIDKR